MAEGGGVTGCSMVQQGRKEKGASGCSKAMRGHGRKKGSQIQQGKEGVGGMVEVEGSEEGDGL